MTRVINFSAGPAALPLDVLERAQAELTNWQGLGMSVMEISHRSKAFIAVAEQAEADVRELLKISDDYAVMFLQGGATLQFGLLPMNLSAPGDSIDCLITGSWSKKAAKEAGVVRSANVVADGGRFELHRRAGAGRLAARSERRVFSLHAERDDRRGRNRRTARVRRCAARG